MNREFDPARDFRHGDIVIITTDAMDKEATPYLGKDAFFSRYTTLQGFAVLFMAYEHNGQNGVVYLHPECLQMKTPNPNRA